MGRDMRHLTYSYHISGKSSRAEIRDSSEGLAVSITVYWHLGSLGMLVMGPDHSLLALSGGRRCGEGLGWRVPHIFFKKASGVSGRGTVTDS